MCIMESMKSKTFQVQSTHNQVLTRPDGFDLRDESGQLVIGKAVYFEGTLEECKQYRHNFPPMVSYKSRSTCIVEVTN